LGLGKWRSLAARCVRDAEVAGSNPAFPTHQPRRIVETIRAAALSANSCVERVETVTIGADSYDRRNVNRLGKHFSYSNVTATLALVVALAGGAYAATLAENSVKSRHIAPDAAKGEDVEESTLGPVRTARGLKHPDFGRFGTPRLFDVMGIGMVMGRMSVSNTAILYAEPLGDDFATGTEANHLMGTYLSGSEADELLIQLPTGSMPASTSRTFTLRAGETSASMADTDMSCDIDAGQSQCSFEGSIPLSQSQDMLSFEIVTTGTPGTQSFVFGYRFSGSRGT
jgi:hypothetical protein